MSKIKWSAWLENDGSRPFNNGVKFQVKVNGCKWPDGEVFDDAKDWSWDFPDRLGGITEYRVEISNEK